MIISLYLISFQNRCGLNYGYTVQYRDEHECIHVSFQALGLSLGPTLESLAGLSEPLMLKNHA